jgi:hypothetical protein
VAREGRCRALHLSSPLQRQHRGLQGVWISTSCPLLLVWGTSLAEPSDADDDDSLAFLASQKSVCDNQTYGLSFGRGNSSFKSGSWVTVKERTRLNDVGKANGKPFWTLPLPLPLFRSESLWHRANLWFHPPILSGYIHLTVDGNTAIKADNVEIRKRNDAKFEGYASLPSLRYSLFPTPLGSHPNGISSFPLLFFPIQRHDVLLLRRRLRLLRPVLVPASLVQRLHPRRHRLDSQPFSLSHPLSLSLQPSTSKLDASII